MKFTYRTSNNINGEDIIEVTVHAIYEAWAEKKVRELTKAKQIRLIRMEEEIGE